MAKKRVFVTGTDTGIGKTIVSAILMVQNPEYSYWKPVQSGLEDETDTEFIQRVVQPTSERIIPETYRLKAPRSPHESAALENLVIDATTISVPKEYEDFPLIIEGAGGLLVPLTEDYFIIDLIQKLESEVILVAKSGLGTLNHTLLSLEALRKRKIPIKGVVLNGPIHDSNRETIKKIGQVEILAEIETVEQITKEWMEKLKLENLYL